jgi:hypothetical protein
MVAFTLPEGGGATPLAGADAPTSDLPCREG